MTRIIFIKQRIRRGPAIESCIEDYVENAFISLPGVSLEVYNLGEKIRLAEDRMRGADPQAVSQARFAETEKCIQHIHGSGHSNVFALNGYLVSWFNPRFFETLRTGVKHIATWQLDDPYYIDMTLRFLPHIDTVFTVDSAVLPVMERYDVATEWLPAACDPDTHKTIPDLDEQHRTDVCFIGVPFVGSRRVAMVDAIADELAKHNSRIIGATENDTWQKGLKNYATIAGQVIDAFIPPDEAHRYFSGAAINLNIHKDSYGHAWDHNLHRLEALSPCERMFSIAGCGGFQLIDATRPDLGRLFKPGEEIVTFTNAGDLKDKIRYFLDNPEERADIAQALQQQVQTEHTYQKRAERIVEVAFSS